INPETTRKIVAMMMAPFAQRDSFESQITRADWHGRSTIEVFNASSRPLAAKAVMNLLRRAGFDVVKIGDFSTRQNQTLVVDRSGDLRPAQAVADSLRAAVAAEVVSRPEPTLHVDVTVIIGNDYQLADKKMSW